MTPIQGTPGLLFHDMADHIHQQPIYSREIDEDLFVYIGDFTFEIRSQEVRHVTITRGTTA